MLNLSNTPVRRGDINYRLAVLRLLAGARWRYDSVQPQALVDSLGFDWHQLNDSQFLCSGQVFVKVLKQIRQLTGDELYGLTNRRCKPGTFSMLSHLALNERNLQAALTQVVRFFDLVCDEVQLHVDRDDSSVTLSLDLMSSLSHESQGGAESFLADFLLFLFQRLFSWWIGFLIPVERVAFKEAEPEANDRFIYLLRAACYEQSERPSVTFSLRYLTMPVVRNPTEWVQHVDNLRNGLFSWPNRDGGTSQRVRRMVAAHLRAEQELMLLPEVAKELAMSSQTLRRRLKDEGASFQAVVDHLRRDLAIEALSLNNETINQVASALGFSEPRSFSRAFKHWTGMAPTEYLRRR